MHQPAMRSDHVTQPNDVRIPPTFLQAGAARFWLAVLCVGIGGGVSAILLTRLLEIVQHLVWAGAGTDMIAGIRGRHDVSDEEGSSSNAAIGGAHRKPGNAKTGLKLLSPATACAFRGGTVGLQ